MMMMMTSLERRKTPFWKVQKILRSFLLSSLRETNARIGIFINWVVQYIKLYLSYSCLFQFDIILLRH